MKKNLTLTILLAAGFGLASAQQNETPPSHRTCGAMENLEFRKKQDPKLEARMQKAEEKIRSYDASANKTAAVIRIPVVFHVVYQNSTENIANSRLTDQLNALNQDYRKTNTDAANVPAVWQGIAADCEIEFCLATQDPSGAPHSGINRVLTSVSTFSTNDAVKYTSSGGADAWDRDQYLNIWVCDLGSSLLGYAQFPGGAAATDGVVLNYRYTGTTGASAPFNKGRTATHEIGHWLGLYHIWGDDGSSCSGSDQVSDTPNQASESYGCFTPGSVQTDGCATSAPGKMWQNYMDYTDDACMYMFTTGQKTRMVNVLNTSRVGLLSSNACGTLAAVDGGISASSSPAGTYCVGSFTPSVTITNFGTSTLTSATITYQVDSNTPSTYTWTGSLAAGASANVTLPTMTASNGSHTFTACTSNPNGSTDGNTNNDCTTSNFTVSGVGQNLPFTEGFENATFVPSGWSLNNPDGAVTWDRTTLAAATGSASAYADNYDYNANGEVDDIITPPLNLASVANPLLSFKVAYRLYTNPASNPNYSDTLQVWITTDCGQTWTSLFSKYGAQLTTITPAYGSAEFVPTASQWRTENISLSSFASSSNVMFRFRNVTQYENNLYLDDINIAGSTGMEQSVLATLINIFPNPSNDVFNVAINTTEKINIRVLDVLGREMTGITPVYNNGYYSLNMADEAKGIYFINISTETETVTKRIVLNK